MHRFRSILKALSVVVAASGSTSLLAEENPWYARLNIGLSSLSDADLTLPEESTASAEFDTGLLSGGAIGRQSGAFRLEAELAYRSNEISRQALPGYRQGSEAGDFASLGLGLNLLYEFNLFGNENVVSYVGAGVTYLEEIDIDLTDKQTNEEVSFSDNSFGLQLMAGARYELSDNWDIFTELRYFDSGTVTLESEADSRLSIETDYETTAFVLGVGYRF